MFPLSISAFYVRLKDGKDSSSGRVEISKNKTVWGTICDDFWDQDAATVVCRQLGFTWGVSLKALSIILIEMLINDEKLRKCS